MDKQIIEICKKQNFDAAYLLTFISVETGGRGFDAVTGKVIIQFEPTRFRELAPKAPAGVWSANKVEVQSHEWVAFNDAFSKDPDAAMQATSVGLGQIMGFHYKDIGYNNVGEMWNDAKRGIEQQVNQLVRYINSNKNLKDALLQKNWARVAELYNGAGYRKLAARLNRVPYDVALRQAYVKFKNI